MNFETHHEQELAEIKGLVAQLDERSAEVLERLRQIEATGSEPLIAFVHIPKTAGGTLRSMFAAAYTKAAIGNAGNYFRGPEKTANKVTKRRGGGWSAWRGRGGRVTIGHTPYGLFREHLPADTRYVTFLREPVDRVLSHYYRHVHLPSADPAGQAAAAAGRPTADSLEQALFEQWRPELNNFQTRFLCGDPEPTGVLPPSAVERARANLREFAFVGIQERFDESVALLQRALGLGVVPCGSNRHVSADRPSVDQISDEQRALIEEHNRLDAELYAFGRGLFEEVRAAAGDALAAHVEELRAVSAALREREDAAVRDACEWLEYELPPGQTRVRASLVAAADAAGIRRLILRRALIETPDIEKSGGDTGEVKLTRIAGPGPDEAAAEPAVAKDSPPTG